MDVTTYQSDRSLVACEECGTLSVGVEDGEDGAGEAPGGLPIIPLLLVAGVALFLLTGDDEPERQRQRQRRQARNRSQNSR